MITSAMAGAKKKNGVPDREVDRVSEDVAQRGRGGLDADSEEVESGFGGDVGRHREREVDQQRSPQVRQDLLEVDAPLRRTEEDCCLDELALTQRQHLPPDHATDGRPAEERQHDHDIETVGDVPVADAQLVLDQLHGDARQRQQDQGGRERQRQVHEAADQRVEEAAAISADDPQHRTEHDREDGRREGDGEGERDPQQQPRHGVATQPWFDTERVVQADAAPGALRQPTQVDVEKVLVGGQRIEDTELVEERRGESDDQVERDDDQRNHRQLVLAEPRCRQLHRRASRDLLARGAVGAGAGGRCCMAVQFGCRDAHRHLVARGSFAYLAAREPPRHRRLYVMQTARAIT